MKFFKGFLVFILIAIIVSGVGYIGYNFLFMNHSGHNATDSQTQQPADTSANFNQNQQNMQGMQHGSTNQQTQQNSNNQQQDNNPIASKESNVILQNKEKLDKAIALINESQRLMSVDPYAPSSSNSGNMGEKNMQPQTGNAPVQPAQGDKPTVTNPGNNTTINIFPQGNNSNTQTNTTLQNSVMQNMGTNYDANKMEQLHAGLYKIAVGRVLLDELKNKLVYQAEYATSNIQNPVQYYSNQYNLTVQNKNKLNQALTYINEAANLVNINPYVSATGLVYDKDRMNQIHQSILKLAEGVALLNQLDDDFTKQANMFQNYVNNANNTNNQQMNHTAMSTGLFKGLFDNISMENVVSILLILFVIGLVFGIFGFIFSLLKTPAQKVTRKEDGAI
jgi:hypothetical protein